LQIFETISANVFWGLGGWIGAMVGLGSRSRNFHGMVKLDLVKKQGRKLEI
jgi:hypothetical protein